MGEVWLPQWERVNLGGPDGDPYADERNIKLLWHRWEGTNWGAAEDAFRAYPPHCAAKLGDRVRQYVPLDEHAYALAGSRNEGEFVIQVEVSGFSRDSRDMTPEEKEWLAHNVLEPILFFFPDLPDVHPTFYDDQSGFTLARADSPQRFSFPDWVAFSGHVGHQHAPAPDDHWDPGLLDLDTIIRIARTNGHVVQSQQQEEEMQPKGVYTIRLKQDPAKPDDPKALVVASGTVYLSVSTDAGIVHYPVSAFADCEEIFQKVLGVVVQQYPGGKKIRDGQNTDRLVWHLGPRESDMIKLPA